MWQANTPRLACLHGFESCWSLKSFTHTHTDGMNEKSLSSRCNKQFILHLLVHSLDCSWLCVGLVEVNLHRLFINKVRNTETLQKNNVAAEVCSSEHMP